MKLRNKKTGEIRNAVDIDMYTDSVYLKVSDGEFDNETIEYHSLAELNEEWEDYEEPKQWWYLDVDGEVCEANEEDGMTKDMKSIGNYFETKEEAEKAVKKLGAWKRLKDKGFRFAGISNYKISFEFEERVMKKAEVFAPQKDLDLLFGGEE